MATVPAATSDVERRFAVDVVAAEYDGMRRRLEYPELEQVDRLPRLLAGMPSALRA
jgi:hypothetical protein